MRFLLTILFIAFSVAGISQTKLTLILKRGTDAPGFDSIRITRFSSEKGVTVLYKDTVTAFFDEKYADLYSVDYYKNKYRFYTLQSWIDTGIVTVKAKTDPRSAALGIIVDTIINSLVTYNAKRFYKELGDYRHRTDTASLNGLLLRNYKENIGNPFSFVIGSIYYKYNGNAIQRYPDINALIADQDSTIKKSIFYDMMGRDRTRKN